MPANAQLISLDLSRVIGGRIDSNLGHTYDYTDDLAINSIAVFAVDLSTLPRDFMESIGTGQTKLTASFVTSTSNLIKHSLSFKIVATPGLGYSADHLITYFSKNASSAERGDAAEYIENTKNFNDLNIDIRKGSAFADSINHQVTQRVDIAGNLISQGYQRMDGGYNYYPNNTTMYFLWDTDVGVDYIRDFNVTGRGPNEAYALTYTDSATASIIKTFGETVRPFSTVTLVDHNGKAPVDPDVVVIPVKPPAPDWIPGTQFKFDEIKIDPFAKIVIRQDNANAGTLEGYTSRKVNVDGSAEYIFTGTAGLISGLLQNLTFTSLNQPNDLSKTITVNFSIKEIDNALNVTLGSGKSVVIGTNMQTVLFGSTVHTVVVNAGQTLTVAGTSTGTIIVSGGKELVQSTGLATGSEVRLGAVQEVYGRAEAALVSDGGTQTVYSGGMTSGTTVEKLIPGLPGATQTVLGGARAFDTKVGSGGWQHVYGLATGSLVRANGVQIVYSGGAAETTTVGGLLEVQTGGKARAAVIKTGGTVEVDDRGFIDGASIQGGSLVVKAGGRVDGQVSFGNGTVDRLKIEDVARPGRSEFDAVLTHIEAGDQIHLSSWTYGSGQVTATITGKSTMSVTNGSSTLRFELGQLDAARFEVTSDGRGGTLLTAVGSATAFTGASAGTVVEAGGSLDAIPGTPTAAGTLGATYLDLSTTFEAIVAGTRSGSGFGTVEMTSGGAWRYQLDDEHAAVQALVDGQTLTDTFRAVTREGKSQVVTLTIHGTNDAPVVSGDGAIRARQGGGTIRPDGDTVLTLEDLNASDIDGPANSLVYTVQAAQSGSVIVAGAAVTSFTQAQLAAGAVSFRQDGSSNTSASFRVTVSDGTATSASKTVNATVDLIPTVTDITYGPHDGTLLAGESVTLSVRFSEAVGVFFSPQLRLSNGGMASYTSGDGTNTLTFSYTAAAGQDTADLGVAEFVYGPGLIFDTIFQMPALPLAGLNPAGTLVVDTIAPDAPSLTGEVATGLVRSTTPTLTGTAEAGSQVLIALDQRAFATVTADTNGRFSYTVSDPLRLGAHTLTASAVDAAGNASTALSTGFAVVDAAAPISKPFDLTLRTLDDSGVSTSDGLTNKGSVTISGHGVSGASVQLFADANGNGLFDRGERNLGTTTVVNGSFSKTVSLSGNGEHRIVAAQRSLDGLGAGSDPLVVTLDRSVPVVTDVSVTGLGLTDGTGTLTVGQTATFTLSLSEAVNLPAAGSNLFLSLSNGGRALYDAAASDATHLVFGYDVLVNQVAEDLTVTGARNGGSPMTDAAGNLFRFAGALTDPNGTLAIDGLTGTDANERFIGTLGADSFHGRGGNDTYYVNDAADLVFEETGGGSDRVVASISHTLAAGQSIEVLQTIDGRAIDAIDLTGNELAQRIIGNAGANVLAGGGGADQLTGGAGADTFVFRTAAESAVWGRHVTIRDFSHAEGDRIDLSGIVTGAADGDFHFAEGALRFSGHAGELIATPRGTATIVQGDLNGDRIADLVISVVTSGTALHESDFLLVA